MVLGVTPLYLARGGTTVMSALVIAVIQVGYSGQNYSSSSACFFFFFALLLYLLFFFFYFLFFFS